MSRLFIIIALSPFLSFAQKQEKKPFSFQDFQQKKIVLSKPVSKLAASQYFDDLIVTDARFDTSAIGFYKNNYFVFDKGAAQTIENQLKDKFDMPGSNTGNQVIIFIKNLWISTQFQSKNISTDLPNDDDWQGGVKCKIECFNKKDSLYYPLFRFDTTIVAKNSEIKNKYSTLIDDCINMLANKILAAYAKPFSAKSKQLNWEEVNQHNIAPFEIPILKQNQLKKGIYANFNEFKNNSPKYAVFEITKTKLADIIYVKDSSTGVSYPLRNVWGYCDGRQIFIKSADNYFPIYRIANSFYLTGAKSLDRKMSSGTENAAASYLLFGNTNARVSKTKYKIHYSPYQVDMETGEIY